MGEVLVRIIVSVRASFGTVLVDTSINVDRGRLVDEIIRYVGEMYNKAISDVDNSGFGEVYSVKTSALVEKRWYKGSGRSFEEASSMLRGLLERVYGSTAQQS